jgi:beta-lactamase class A
MPRSIVFLFSISILITSCAEPPGDPLPELEEDIHAELSRSPGTFALAFRDLGDTSRTLLINDTVLFHAASTMKTPVMIEVYKQAEQGRFEMGDSIVIKNVFFSIVDSSEYSMDIGEDSEEKLYERIGMKASIKDLVVDMITYSSNLATNIVIDLVDAKKVTQTMRELGAPYIQVLRGVEDIKAVRQGLSNRTSAYDLMVIYEKLGRGKVVSPEASEEMIDILLEQHFNEVIPAQLPEEVKVAHKTGWITQVRHDSGLVFLPDGRKYVLVLLSKDWESDELATEVMANVSKMVYDYYTAHTTTPVTPTGGPTQD